MTESIKLLYGDCLELLNDVENKSIDLVCCDMPYGTTNCRWDTVIDLSLLWEQYLNDDEITELVAIT